MLQESMSSSWVSYVMVLTFNLFCHYTKCCHSYEKANQNEFPRSGNCMDVQIRLPKKRHKCYHKCLMGKYCLRWNLPVLTFSPCPQSFMDKSLHLKSLLLFILPFFKIIFSFFLTTFLLLLTGCILHIFNLSFLLIQIFNRPLHGLSLWIRNYEHFQCSNPFGEVITWFKWRSVLKQKQLVDNYSTIGNKYPYTTSPTPLPPIRPHTDPACGYWYIVIMGALWTRTFALK